MKQSVLIYHLIEIVVQLQKFRYQQSRSRVALKNVKRQNFFKQFIENGEINMKQKRKINHLL